MRRTEGGTFMSFVGVPAVVIAPNWYKGNEFRATRDKETAGAH
jgi:hypothetical protein